VRLWLDTDSDGWNDAEDCAPGDPAAWQIPGEARVLSLQGEATTDLFWAAPLTQEWGGTVVLFDAMRSPWANDFLTPTCLKKDTTDYTAEEPAAPPAGSVYFYLIRAKNVCGGNLGEDSQGNPRVGGLCP
jgi:hypothetical protein